MTVLALVRKELTLYFTSFLFWVVAAIFLALSGYFFWTNLDFYVRMGGMNLGLGLWQYQLYDLRQLLLALVPLFTMRLLAEERRLGTLELLWTYPLRDGTIVVAKFLACLLVLCCMLAVTLVHPLILSRLHPVAAGPLVAGYTGLVLLAAACVAAGLFCSALTDSQIVAGAAAYGLLLFFWILTWNEAALGEGALRLLVPFSLFDRFQTFARGGIDTRDASFLVCFTVAFLAFTFLALDARRWRGLK